MSGDAIAPFRIVADDLTGAAEAAGALHETGIPAVVRLQDWSGEDRTEVLDLDVRNAPPLFAGEHIDRAFRNGPPPGFVKIDSQLRGPIVALLAAATRRGPVLLAPALPGLGRTVVDGVPLIDGVPLRHSSTTSWRTEHTLPPRSLVDVVPPQRTHRRLPLPLLRDAAALRAFLSSIADDDVVIADAEDAHDLALLAGAVLGTRPDILPMGSSALLRAFALLREAAGSRPSSPAESAVQPRNVLLVIGSLEPVVRRQRARLAAPEVEADREGAVAQLRSTLRTHGSVVLTTTPHDGPQDVEVARRIGAVAAAAVHDDPATALVLIGGESARSVLHRLGEETLHVRGVIHPGATFSVTDTGRQVVTRPGSFGGDDSLALITQTLRGGDLSAPPPQKEGQL